MGFESDLIAKQVSDFDWELVASLKYRGNEALFEVPAESKTDFASVPAIFQWLIPRSGRYTRAAVLHDHLWRTRKVSLADADGIFRRAMAELKVPFLRRWLMWTAVRWVSLARSGFSDGKKDIPRVLLITLVPGSVVVAGGLVALVLLLAFWTVELIVRCILWAVPRAAAERLRLKPRTWPTVLWSS